MFKHHNTTPIQYISKNINDKSNNTIKTNNNNHHKLSYEEIRKIVEKIKMKKK